MRVCPSDRYIKDVRYDIVIHVCGTTYTSEALAMEYDTMCVHQDNYVPINHGISKKQCSGDTLTTAYPSNHWV